ncbi:ribbon-helix-helix domain-containing protein [Halogeometricum sp. S1BR25-6]|uniref:Ribbon-helix-helix domain-containing protein n=1 Tax=Halogeometricum salsisoli TaxID=2950536 RepID=A0ABU2GL10_9EURY|nr:ribbon-helix-helix domain-containing protein [Halogeometricum sp. S1BR25-6]MDS0300958.1 ribbon-helix-helix domain-containing protein [Halogeometricum sp. S1BR25-6]
MKYASVSVKFPVELDTEIERFLDETGVYTNKSEFIKEACRAHLRDLNDDTAIAALRLEQLLAQAEQSRESDSEIDAELAALSEKVDAGDLERAVEDAREETSEQVYGSDA